MDHGSFRSSEFPQLDLPAGNSPVYLDWAGAALPPASLIRGHCEDLTRRVLGNPHSAHEASKASVSDMDMARQLVLSHFKASVTEYDVIFTSGATGAILLLQHFLIGGGELLLTADNHNSINGLREIVKNQHGRVRYIPLDENLNIDWEIGEKCLWYPVSNGAKLFAMPAKSNYSGIHHDLKWMMIAQERGWKVLLDASSYLANDDLDLSIYKPDFVPVSFYKLFGYPTGLGCLLVRKSSLHYLRKKWFSGGSILLASVVKDFFEHEIEGHARFEDGTQDFGNMKAVTEGFKFLFSLKSSGFKRSTHARQLAREFAKGLLSMKPRQDVLDRFVIHSSLDSDMVTFSLIRDGSPVDAWRIEQAASKQGIYVRSGCFCNPGCNEKVFGYKEEEFDKLLATSISPEDLTLERFGKVSGKPIGAIRASFGYANNSRDVERALNFFQDQLLPF